MKVHCMKLNWDFQSGGGGGGGAPDGEVWIFYLTFTVQSPTTLRIIGKKYNNIIIFNQ